MNNEQLQQTDMPVGEILRRTRLHYGQSLTDIERALRIRAAQIDAIETGKFDQLPGRVYAIGFVRSYAEYLGLDGDKMVGLFKSQFGGKTSQPELHFPVAASESKIPPIWVVGASLVGVIFLIAGWWGLQGGDRSMVTEIPPVQVVEQVQQEDVGPEEVAGPPVPSAEEMKVAASPPPAESPKTGIILIMQENSWVEIKDKDGKPVVSRVLNAGDKYYVPDRPDLTISLGNAAGIQIQVDGVALKPLGGPGQVRRNIPLDTAFLKKNFAAQ